jgi:hypothetical protein
VLLEEVPGQEGDVLRTVAQRWDVDDAHGQAVPEVLPEAPALYLGRQIPVGGCHEAEVGRHGSGAADGHDGAGFEDAQQGGLQVQAQFADLVQEERAAIRLADGSGAAVQRAGEGAPFVPEERGHRRLGMKRPAVHRHPRPGAAAQEVESPGHSLLACPRLPQHEDRNGEGGEATRFCQGPAHQRGVGEDVGEAGYLLGILGEHWQDRALLVLGVAGDGDAPGPQPQEFARTQPARARPERFTAQAHARSAQVPGPGGAGLDPEFEVPAAQREGRVGQADVAGDAAPEEHASHEWGLEGRNAVKCQVEAVQGGVGWVGHGSSVSGSWREDARAAPEGQEFGIGAEGPGGTSGRLARRGDRAPEPRRSPHRLRPLPSRLHSG